MERCPITILENGENGKLKIEPDSKTVSASVDGMVEWTSTLPDWRVIFGPNAPVHPKVASPAHPFVDLKRGRAEDIRHVKYTVVAWTGEKLKDIDPELIVDE
jgi:hypothetical protein